MMRSVADESTEPEVQSGGGEQPSAEPVTPETPAAPSATPATEEWGGPSRQEWETMVQAANWMFGRLQEGGEEPEAEEDLSEEELAKQYIQSMISEHPSVVAAAEQSGKATMKELFSQYETKENLDFDHRLAEQIADNIIGQRPGLDPHQVLRYAAGEAASIRQQEREAGEKSYKERVGGKKQGEVPDLQGVSGTAVGKKFGTYDEVTNYYSGEEDV